VPFVLLAVVALLPLLFVVLLPFSIVQRYRVGTVRRVGRSWVASLNLFFIALSCLIFLWASAVMNFWVPNAFLSALAGLAGGCLLGLLGLKLTRWEPTARALHYTPNRPLVLLITIGVAARILYGFWRGWEAWRTAGTDTSWLAASGAAGSLAVGAIVLGYYVTYWAGVGRRVKHHRRNNRWQRVRAAR
jgi:hypothetical protein